MERLKSNLKQMEQKLMENRDTVNDLNHYNRSSYVTDLSEMLFKKGENCLEIIIKIRRMGNIEDCEPVQVDIAHFTFRKKTIPITSLFDKKSDRQNFNKQKRNHINLM